MLLAIVVDKIENIHSGYNMGKLNEGGKGFEHQVNKRRFDESTVDRNAPVLKKIKINDSTIEVPYLGRVISQYPMLETLASFVSTRDLHNLAATCKSNYTHVRSSRSTFGALR